MNHVITWSVFHSLRHFLRMIYFRFSAHFLVFRAQPVALTGFCRIVGDGLRSRSDVTDLGDSSMLILGSRSSSDKSIIVLYLLIWFKMSFGRQLLG